MPQTKTGPLAFIRCRRAAALCGSAQKVLFYIWNGSAFVLSSLVLAVLSLCFAFGTYDWGVFFGYFQFPIILLLNWLPILMFQLLLFCVFGRQWAAFLGSALFFILPSVGNFYKLKIRFEPFTFQDMGSVSAGLRIAGRYDLPLTNRIIVSVIAAAFILAVMIFFVRGTPGKRFRLTVPAAAVFCSVLLWLFVYSDAKVYDDVSRKNNYLGGITAENRYVQCGFVYPFIFSISQSIEIPPEGYNEADAQAILDRYNDADIPADKRVNLLVFQLESFVDLEQTGVAGIDDNAYAVLHRLQQESLSGTMVADVIGGGTISSERSFLTGSHGLASYTYDTPSFVRYLREQGYLTTGSHMNRADFYNRLNVNRYIGFEEYFFTDNYYHQFTVDDNSRDRVLMEQAVDMLLSAADDGRQVFSFNVGIQGHSPYDGSQYSGDTLYWPGADASDNTRNCVNNYLLSVACTQQYLSEQLDRLRDAQAPVVVLIYGDHSPVFSGDNIYKELGLSFDMSTMDGVVRYYGTPYLIWANDSAKTVLGNDFTGSAPTISPGYLMSVLFDELGWQGSAFMQFTRETMDTLPLASTLGYYIENGNFTTQLSPEASALLNEYKCAQFWLHGSLRR